MLTRPAEQVVHAVQVTKDEEIAAPVEIVFETLLEQLGPHHETAPGYPLPMKLEPWPGGRWYRDLGDNTGHFWGHVQVIKPPRLLEICGPFFMSYPAMSHVQYRLTPNGDRTQLTFAYQVVGQIPSEHLDGFGEGMEPMSHTVARIREAAERRNVSPGGRR